MNPLPHPSAGPILRALTAVLAVALALPCGTPAEEAPDAFLASAPPHPLILFQGDSITDGNRGRTDDPNHILGHGYQFIIAAAIGAHAPERNVRFLNRGISGNGVADLARRWQEDAIALAPDVLSILIGINDYTHAVDGRATGSAADYERDYDALLAATRSALPLVRFVLGEPFILPVGKRANGYPALLDGLIPYQQAVGRLAVKYHAPLIHYQRLFDDACRRAPPAYWVWDGVHPTYAGHGLMAREWLTTVNAYHDPAH